MSLCEITKEVEQIKEIKDLNINEIGFVCSSGFKNKQSPYKYVTLSDVFKFNQKNNYK